ncbi:hypothetical protein CBR_g1112 [Chara braunii]|uniref:Uncharacterized protein n=1 Tax=Chara braunii TaxID=69332 RepID=A0A388KDH3_CHABU|nr:hypothetical protein CBR_g1112 [Chara braunii]|eukprot:GBG67993.1 hypothetical protein CBR_g1112 [Chara braunii]
MKEAAMAQRQDGTPKKITVKNGRNELMKEAAVAHRLRLRTRLIERKLRRDPTGKEDWNKCVNLDTVIHTE